MKRLFAGTPEFAACILETLLAQRVSVDAVLTQPDRRAGRGLHAQPSAVKRCAMRHRIRVLQPPTLANPNAIAALAGEAADLWIVVAYGCILPPPLLHKPRHGCINVHPSLLPRWRGASPIQHALLSGDTTTGVTLMRMDEGMDSGPLLAAVECPISAEDTAATLHDRLADAAARLLLTHLPSIENATLPALPQDAAGVTYAPRLRKADAVIDWHNSAAMIDRHIRGMAPWPIAYTHIRYPLRSPVVLRIRWARPLAIAAQAPPGTVLTSDNDGIVVQCAEGGMRLLTVQAPGAKPMSAAEYIHGHPLQPGCLLG